MLSDAKHLCSCSRRNWNGNNQRFFASLNDNVKRRGRDDATLLCALRLDFDVDRNRLADARDCLGRRGKHQVEIAPRDWIDRYTPTSPARVVERCN